MELAQNRVQKPKVSNLRVLLPANLIEIGYEHGRWMELAQNRVQRPKVPNLRVLQPANWSDLTEISYEDGRWMELAQNRVQWHYLILVVLNIQGLLPQLRSVLGLFIF
jgi:hypothetical protein